MKNILTVSALIVFCAVAGCRSKCCSSAASSSESSGWKPLFADDLSDADFAGGWRYEQGLLSLTPGEDDIKAPGQYDIRTKKRYGDFILDLDFKLGNDTNSGVFLRTQNKEWLPWVEVQVLDSFGKPVDTHICGAIFGVLAPTRNIVRPAGQWNHYTITAEGPFICVVLNGEKIIDMDLNKWTDAHKNPDGTANNFDVAFKDLPREGFICLQNHGFRVWYRNMKIKELN